MVENKVKSIEEFSNILEEEITLELRARLDESLSSKLYHFCPLAAAASIIKDGRFHLSHIDRNGSEGKMAKVVSSRRKATYPYTKTVDTVEDLPKTEECGAIYRVRKGTATTPILSCYEFDGDKWNYLKGSDRNNNKNELYAKKGSVFATKLSNGKVSYTDDSGRLKGEYYMCFSRVPGAFDGYSGRMSLEKWKGVYVRFSVNGDILNHRYKGEPVNFYTDGAKLKDHLRDMDINTIGKGESPLMTRKKMKTDNSLGKKFANEIDRIKVYEHEDRLFSNDPDIPSKKSKANLFSSGIVERIDIFVSSGILESADDYMTHVLNQIGDILKRCKQYGILKLVHIYDKEKGLSMLPLQELLGKVNPNRRSKLMDKFKDYIELNKPAFQEKFKDFFNKKIAKYLTESEATFIADLLGILNYGHFSDNESYLANIKKMIKAYDLSGFAEDILKKIKPLEFYQDEVKSSYFGFSLRVIYGCINNLQGWKIQEVGDKLRRMINDYAKKNKLPKIGSINSFKTKQWKQRHGIEIIDRRKKEFRKPKKSTEPTLFTQGEISEMVSECLRRLGERL